MYARKTQSWLKHIDFILLDILCLHVAFVLAYMTRHGFANPYGKFEYLSLAAIYTLVSIWNSALPNGCSTDTCVT